MIKYCQIIDAETGLVAVADGTNVEYYKSIGMVERNVDLSDIDNNWYLAEKCPHKSEEEKAKEREEVFKNEFFEIQGYNFYRKKPKGYTSALESLTVAYNMITSGIIQELPAGTFIFYPEPDYTKPEQCTEEWLIEHHILSDAMTAQQFLPFYTQFVVAWNEEMHKADLSQEVE